MKTALLTILVFGVIILLHEFGHFLFAKLFGVRVNEFSFGMGPRLWSRKGKTTEYSLRLFPIGGYVAMEGEDEESGHKDAFCNKKVWQRILIVFAGAFFNIVLGLVVILFLTFNMEHIPTNIIARVEDNGIHQPIVLQEGDRIVSVNGYSTENYQDLYYQLMRDADGVVDLEIRRGADLLTTRWDFLWAKLGLSDTQSGEIITVKGYTFTTESANDGGIAVKINFLCYSVPKTFSRALTYSFQWTGAMVKQVWYSLWDILTGRFGFSDLSGPVGTATVISQASSYGYRSFLIVFALITINVGVFNLLPLPALDGGRLLFMLVELIFRRPIPAKYENFVHAAGMILLLILVAAVTFKDILMLF